jgi:hypothetical protein
VTRMLVRWAKGSTMMANGNLSIRSTIGILPRFPLERRGDLMLGQGVSSVEET